jgi:hypothetical protein
MGKLEPTWPLVPQVDGPIAEPLFQRLGRPTGGRPVRSWCPGRGVDVCRHRVKTDPLLSPAEN